MAAINYDLAIEAGAGFLVEFAQAESDGTPIPFVAGSTAEFQARVDARATGAPLLTLSPAVDAAAGKVTLHISDTDTRALDLPTVDSTVYAIEIHPPTRTSETYGAVHRLVVRLPKQLLYRSCPDEDDRRSLLNEPSNHIGWAVAIADLGQALGHIAILSIWASRHVDEQQGIAEWGRFVDERRQLSGKGLALQPPPSRRCGAQEAR